MNADIFIFSPNVWAKLSQNPDERDKLPANSVPAASTPYLVIPILKGEVWQAFFIRHQTIFAFLDFTVTIPVEPDPSPIVHILHEIGYLPELHAYTVKHVPRDFLFDDSLKDGVVNPVDSEVVYLQTLTYFLEKPDTFFEHIFPEQGLKPILGPGVMSHEAAAAAAKRVTRESITTDLKVDLLVQVLVGFHAGLPVGLSASLEVELLAGNMAKYLADSPADVKTLSSFLAVLPGIFQAGCDVPADLPAQLHAKFLARFLADLPADFKGGLATALL